ncbi:hypothetical protein BDR06DRAFT_357060 [Suillus hirtellus]|nr:hypothetical protein BDR06DRAFT_357060 [Suillus hirtellus]
MAFLVYLMNLAFSSRPLPAPAEVGTANITKIQWPLRLYNQKSGFCACYRLLISHVSITQHESRCIRQCNESPLHQVRDRINRIEKQSADSKSRAWPAKLREHKCSSLLRSHHD